MRRMRDERPHEGVTKILWKKGCGMVTRQKSLVGVTAAGSLCCGDCAPHNKEEVINSSILKTQFVYVKNKPDSKGLSWPFGLFGNNAAPPNTRACGRGIGLVSLEPKSCILYTTALPAAADLAKRPPRRFSRARATRGEEVQG